MIWPFSTIADLRAALRQAHEAEAVWKRTARKLGRMAGEALE